MRRVVLSCLLGLGLAVQASGCGEDWNTTPGIYNRRNHPLEAKVRVAHTCGANTDLQDPANYGPPVTRRLLAYDAVDLQTLKSLASARYAASGSFDDCNVVWLELPGHYEAVLSWTTWQGWDAESDPYDHALVVEGTRYDLVLRVPDGMRELPPPEL